MEPEEAALVHDKAGQRSSPELVFMESSVALACG
jgi:hypothetical protein